MSMVARSGVTRLSSELRVALAETSPTQEDLTFAALWSGLSSLTNEVGARLLSAEDGEGKAAAWEVQMYLPQLDRVSYVAVDIPLRVPLLAVRAWKSLARYVDTTRDLGELMMFLLEVPPIGAAFSEYSARVLGRHAAPVIDSLTLSVRAGSVFQDALRRTAVAQLIED